MKPRPIIYPEGKDYALVQLTQCKFSKIDIEDGPRVGEFNWYLNSKDYGVRNIVLPDSRQHIQYLHRFINQTPVGFDTDHINRNPLDNTQKNLRTATRGENNGNSKRHKNSTSFYKGVSWYAPRKMWQAMIRKNGKLKHLGYFYNEIEATSVYDDAARKHFGKFANTNFNLDGGRNMTRREAIDEMKARCLSLVNFLQGDKGDKTIHLIDECAEVEVINVLVDALEDAQGYCDAQTEVELELENDFLPDEGNPGYAVGQ